MLALKLFFMRMAVFQELVEDRRFRKGLALGIDSLGALINLQEEEYAVLSLGTVEV